MLRRRRLLDSPQGIWIECGGQRLLNFCSNDYLGLASHPELVQALADGARRWGAGSGSAHLVCGHARPHHALEEELADLTGRERCLLFSTGYMANLGVISALLERGDQVYQDRLNHASLLDGGLLSGARLQRYRHADLADLKTRLQRAPEGRRLIVTDAVFSMDGDLAPLPELAVVAREHGAWLMVDDAHGFGVLGERGGGSLSHYGLGQDAVGILVGTLGKACGTFGAFVAGSATLIEFLLQRARSYIYTTALSPALAEATRTGLGLIRKEAWRRRKLKALVARFRAGGQQLELPLMASTTPIQPLLLGDSARALKVSEDLREQGFWVAAIRPPTVPAGAARLRITLSANHQEAQVDALLESLAGALRRHGPPV